MIGYIKGTIEGIYKDYVIIDNQGIGYIVFTSHMMLEQVSLHQEKKLFTYMNVREDEMSLYGFSTLEELDYFKLLISVNGIGPKAALAILSVLTVKDLALAIMSGDSKAISKANGVGAKGANRVIMELKDKINIDDYFETDGGTEVVNAGITGSDSVQDTVLALVSLGYSESEALMAVKKVEHANELEADALLKAALKKMF